MNTEPKPATGGEWTPQSVRDLIDALGGRSDVMPFRVIADAHNAALDAERELVEELKLVTADEVTEAQMQAAYAKDQLAAETRKYSDITHKWEQCVIENQQLREQLAAERKNAVTQLTIARQLRAELAAERKKVENLQRQLDDFGYSMRTHEQS